MVSQKIDEAKRLATAAHKGQTRWGGEPYIIHPAEVAKKVNKFQDETTTIVAWLHDVVEDTDITLEQIRHQFGDKVALAIDAITKRPSDSYKDYILRVRQNWYASVVKIADIEHNLESLKKGSMKDKYELALYFLKNF